MSYQLFMLNRANIYIQVVHGDKKWFCNKCDRNITKKTICNVTLELFMKGTGKRVLIVEYI